MVHYIELYVAGCDKEATMVRISQIQHEARIDPRNSYQCELTEGRDYTIDRYGDIRYSDRRTAEYAHHRGLDRAIREHRYSSPPPEPYRPEPVNNKYMELKNNN